MVLTYEKVYISEQIPFLSGNCLSFWYLNIFKDLGFFDSQKIIYLLIMFLLSYTSLFSMNENEFEDLIEIWSCILKKVHYILHIFEIEFEKLMKDGTICKQDPARNLSIVTFFVNDQFCRKRCTEAQIHWKISIYVCT